MTVKLRDALLRFRNDLNDIEQWRRQDRPDKVKENLEDLSERIQKYAEQEVEQE